ncbi:MAG: pyridoxal phosphate-dependent aminotransferase [Firmicutes bacterium]|nr:pyridoxal phosphate-dependent aminotransferase [Bacillota bacterium]
MDGFPISTRAGRIKQPEIRRIFNMALAMKDVIHLEIGEPDFPTPPHVVRAAAEAAECGWTKYAPSMGDPALRAAVAEKARRQNSIEADPTTEVIITHGAMGALAALMLTLVDDGDEVLIPDPGWINYTGHAQLAGATPVYVRIREEDGFGLDPDAVRAAMTPRTKAVIVNNPSNPTGGVTSRENLVEIARMCADAGAYLVSDEVYESILFEGEHFSPASLPEVRDWVITVNSFSKTYSMTGWRVGYVIARPHVIRAMTRVQEHMVASVTTVSQRAALAALTGPQDCVSTMVFEYKRRRDLVVSGFNRIPGFSCRAPAATFYAFPSAKGIGMTSSDLAMRLLEKTGVALVPGSAFGAAGEGYLRVSFANSEANIREALARIERAVAEIAGSSR